MFVNLLLILVSINTIASQLLVKKGVTQLGGIRAFAELPRFIPLAATSPWILLSIFLQNVGYLTWFLVVTREKIGRRRRVHRRKLLRTHGAVGIAVRRNRADRARCRLHGDTIALTMQSARLSRSPPNPRPMPCPPGKPSQPLGEPAGRATDSRKSWNGPIAD